jgi:hypothetical protein
MNKQPIRRQKKATFSTTIPEIHIHFQTESSLQESQQNSGEEDRLETGRGSSKLAASVSCIRQIFRK